MIGINKIGKHTDGKPGCYIHTIVQTDLKINSTIMKLILPILPRSSVTWGSNFRKFLDTLEENKAGIKGKKEKK